MPGYHCLCMCLVICNRGGGCKRRLLVSASIIMLSNIGYCISAVFHIGVVFGDIIVKCQLK